MELYLEKLKEQDAKELFAFECSNRAFFEKTVPSRGEDYYTFETFHKTFYELLQEQFEGISYFHLIRNHEGTIVGRINLVDIEKEKELGYLGYRIGEKYAGRGIATKSVKLLLDEAANYHVTEIHAKTTTDNISSQKVLEKSHFSRISMDINIDQIDFIHYVWKYTNQYKKESKTFMDLRYPIGHFTYDATITQETIENWIRQIETLPTELKQAIKDLNTTQLDTPYRPDGWTVRQVVHHIADSHMNSYIRFKLALTENNPMIKPYMEEKWADLPDSELPVDISLALLESLHKRWVALLKSMKSSDFEKTFHHPESGTNKLDATIGLYAWHGRHHTAHITSLRNRLGW